MLTKKVKKKKSKKSAATKDKDADLVSGEPPDEIPVKKKKEKSSKGNALRAVAMLTKKVKKKKKKKDGEEKGDTNPVWTKQGEEGYESDGAPSEAPSEAPSDISDASRLDAELARSDAKPVDLEVLISSLVDISREIRSGKKAVKIDCVVEQKPGANHAFIVHGHDLRLGQIVTNLIENARSFVPEETGRILVKLSRSRSRYLIQVEDNGPGIQAEDIDRIFERFYTDRPEGESFGQNSGLGLSISRQIAEAHGGTLRAENVMDPATGRITGARFILSLPVAAAA